MTEILVWGNPEKDFARLEVEAKQTYIPVVRENYFFSVPAVYEVTEQDLDKMIKEEMPFEVKDKWVEACWRHALGSNMNLYSGDHPICRYNVKGRYIKAWDGLGRTKALEDVNGNTSHPDYCYPNRKYRTLLEYFCEEIGVSTERNVCALAVDLAKLNDLTMAELFKNYQ